MNNTEVITKFLSDDIIKSIDEKLMSEMQKKLIHNLVCAYLQICM